MECISSTLSAAPLPSASPLMGTLELASAQDALQQAWNTVHRKPNRAAPGRGTVGRGEQVSALSELAKQHVGSLTSAPAAPYKRAMTPQERQKTAETLAKQTEALGRALLTAAAAQSTDGQEASAGQGNSAEPSSDVAKPMTPQQIVRGLRDLISRSRPASTLSVHEMTLQRPASRLTALRSPELTSSCPGPLSQLYHPPSSQPCTPGSPSAGPRTPKRLGSRGGPLRASAPAGLLSCGMPRTPPDVWVNPNARVNTDSEERDRALLRSSMGNRAAADATGTASASASAAAARARLLASRARTPGALPDDSLAFTLPSRPATAAVAEGAASKLLGSGHVTKPRWGPGQPLYHFVPTRGLLYRTFAELDPGDTGKLTYSEFEEACVRCGLRQQQTQKLFDKLDPQGRGYFTMRDWGSPEHCQEVTDFTRLYIQSVYGASGRPVNVREMKSATLAVQVALSKLQIQNRGHIVSQDKLMAAFEFMDLDGSGALSLNEVQDGFNAMGIYLAPEVLDEIMYKFDSNKNGVIEYREFINALYPVLSKGL